MRPAGYCLHPSGGRVSRRLAQGVVGAAEEARGLRWLGTLFRRKGDRQTPADESIFAAAEGAVCSPAQQDPMSSNTCD